MTTIAPDLVKVETTALLRTAGLPDVVYSVSTLPGGRNNKVYRVESSAGRYLLKSYYHDPRDSRDRLAHEAAFLRHAERVGCSAVPRLFASHLKTHTALLEFVEGRPVTADSIDAASIDEACAVYRCINSDLTDPEGRNLPPASEACFSIAEHVGCTQRRVDRLASIVRHDEIDVAAVDFVANDLVPLWRDVRASIESSWPNDSRTAVLATDERCLSPSDFGFHNALRESSGRLRFLDFEYAGWDDPAKLICDFANQPDIPPPPGLAAEFAAAVVTASARPHELARRAGALEPLYQIKWACICLNDFLATGRNRYRFTTGDASDSSARRALQLERSRQMLARAAARHAPNPVLP